MFQGTTTIDSRFFRLNNDFKLVLNAIKMDVDEREKRKCGAKCPNSVRIIEKRILSSFFLNKMNEKKETLPNFHVKKSVEETILNLAELNETGERVSFMHIKSK